MKILLVDNGSRFLPNLLKRLPRKETVVAKRRSLSKYDPNNFDLVVISGGHSYSIKNHRNIYARELAFIKNAKTPILGICLGFELIVTAFDGTLTRLPVPENGAKTIIRRKKNFLTDHLHASFTAYESHRWAAKKLPKNFTCLAGSNDGAEMIYNKTRKVLGLQFHPEMTSKKSAAYKIVANFLRTLK